MLDEGMKSHFDWNFIGRRKTSYLIHIKLSLFRNKSILLTHLNNCNDSC